MAQAIADAYTRELHEQLEYLATWPPDDTIAIGDVGLLDGHRFVPQGTLVELGIVVGETRAVRQGDAIYTSKEAASIDVKFGGAAAGELVGLAAADAGLVVKLNRAGAVVLAMRDRQVLRVVDQIALGRRLLRAWGEDIWQPDWCAVVEVVQTAATTAVISSGSAGRLELRAAASVQPAGIESLADASLGLTRVHEHHVGWQSISRAGATPLLRALRLKKPFWTRTPEVFLEGIEPLEEMDTFLDPDEPESLFELLGPGS